MTSWRVKRIYDDPSPEDGYRVLVDRLWPRGVSKEEAHLDEWRKEVAPSTEVRQAFDHVESRFEAFRKAYRKELDESGAARELATQLAKEPVVTLLISAKVPQLSQGAVLQEYLQEH